MRRRFETAAGSGSLRRRRRVARRRRSVWAVLGRHLVVALLLVGLPVVAGARWLTSPRFHLRQVQVEGCRRVDPAWVEGILAPLAGKHLLWITLPEVEKRLGRHPWVEGVEIRKELPDRLWVRLRERLPAALLRRPGALHYVDRSGVVIAPLEPGTGPVDLPLLSFPAGEPLEVARALEVAAELGSAVPEWGQGLSEIEVLGDGDYRLYTSALRFPLLGRRGRLVVGARRLLAHLPEIERRFAAVEAVDLRFRDRIVIQPAAEAPLS